MMQWQYTPYVLPLIVSAAVSAALAFFAWRRRSVPGAAPLALLMLAVVEWSLAYGLELGGVGLRTKVFWVKVEYLGIVAAPAAWLAFALQYTDRGKWLTRRNAILLAVVPLVTLLQAWTNESHGLMWSDIGLDTSGSFEMLDLTYGRWWWINTAYTYGLLVLGTGLLVQTVLHSPHLYRRQAAALLTGVLAPWVGNVLYIFDLGPFPKLDLTPSAFTLTGLALTWSLFHYRLFDIVPIARGVILENMDDSVMVLDAQNRVVDANLAATRVIGRPIMEIIGQPVEQVLCAWPDLIERYRDVTEMHTEIALDVGETQRHYDLRISPLFAQRDHLAGRLLVSRDITERRQAEEALRESEEKYRTLVEQSLQGLIVIQDFRVVFTNLAVAEISGYTVEELLSLPSEQLRALVHPDDQAFVWGRYRDRLEGKPVPPRYEFRLIRKDGTIGWLEMFSRRIEYGGKPAVQAILVNITERKQVEEALRKTDTRFRLALRSANVGLWDNDLRTGESFVSPEWKAQLGLEGKVIEDLDREWRDRLHPEERERVLAAWTGYLAGERSDYEVEFRLRHQDGSYRWVLSRGEAMRDEGGELIRILGCHIDIAKRKRAEEALKESEEKLRLIFENAFDGISIYEELPGKSRRLLDCNERYAEMSGRSKEELLEVQNTSLVQRNLGPFLSDEENLRIRRNQQTYRGLFSWIRPDGKENIVEYSAAPIHVGGRALTVGVDRDITERKQAEETLRETNRRLEETLAELKATQERMMQQERLAAVGQLAAGIAHEFNNIMASVALYTQMSLRTSELSPKTRERLETIAGQTERATDLVQQILDFGRRAMLRREILDIAPLLEEATSLLERTLPENVEIDLAYAPGEYTVNADPERVQQAIVNLALNARDAMPDGGALHIGLDRLRIEEDQDTPLPEMKVGEWVRVTVTDTGTGIPPEVLPHIYEPFFTTRAPLGHGLGLSQAYGIVKQHEGHIGVETQMGEGTTFTVYWPALPVTESQLEIPVRGMTSLARGNGETILVVEDNHILRAALVDCLEMLNYRVLEADNGREALAVYEEHQDEISLVLSDWVMQVMGGLELVRALRQRHPAMKVLMLTDHSLDQEVKDTAPEGVVGWVQKPPQLEQLAEVVARALGTN